MIGSSQIIAAPRLALLPNIVHGFFTRDGGVSRGLYGSLNCGFGSADDPAHVAENRARCAAKLETDTLVTVHQVHGVTVARATASWAPADAPRADAIVTDRPGLALGILTADCAPVLLADAEAGVIGAAHAGWKGAKTGVVEAAIAAMTALGAHTGRIVAAVGPAIGLASYEVGEDFRDAFLADNPSAAEFFAIRPGQRPHFDLQCFVARRVEALGVASVDRIEADTCAEPERFFSYRRSCHAREPDYGRQLSAIALAAH
jgi:YfiH family protein